MLSFRGPPMYLPGVISCPLSSQGNDIVVRGCSTACHFAPDMSCDDDAVQNVRVRYRTCVCPNQCGAPGCNSMHLVENDLVILWQRMLFVAMLGCGDFLTGFAALDCSPHRRSEDGIEEQAAILASRSCKESVSVCGRGAEAKWMAQDQGTVTIISLAT